MRSFNGYAIYGIVFLIAVLLIGNIYLIYRNSGVIEYNKTQFEHAEKTRVNTVEIIRNLHLVDMALRSYALVKQEKFLVLADTSIDNKDDIFNNLEKLLAAQQYPMQSFYTMRDSVNAYYKIINQMQEDLSSGRFDEFVKSLEPDPGYRAFLAFSPFSANVELFESRVSEKAQHEYRKALRNSYLLQILLCIIAIPTLTYTAYYATGSINLSEQLRKSNEENYRIVNEQKARLENMVQERTGEIVAQNEKIMLQHVQIIAHNDRLVLQQREIESQRNELTLQNKQLQEAKKIIEHQNKQIQIRHDELAVEVDKQTQNLKKTNLELIEHNSRLEQFTYIISHNLRAPMARLTGLSSVLEHARDSQESNAIIRMMINSTNELDQVIKDLGMILGVQKAGALLMSKINLKEMLQKVTAMLAYEIRETEAKIYVDFSIEILYSLQPYVESILYNLISNSIKYRHPDRSPVIRVNSKTQNGLLRIDIADNGLGIDLEQNKSNIFNLYKRFHFHVEGKGLGLYLVKTQAMALGGTIDVQSKINEGTVFTLLLKNNN